MSKTIEPCDMHDINDFGGAMLWLNQGRRVRRREWSGNGTFIFLIKEWTYTDGKQDNYPNEPFIALKTANNRVAPWQPSPTDVWALDWEMAD